MDPDQQLMAQALSGPGMPATANPDMAQLQAQPNFPKDLSPAALAALFLVPGVQRNWNVEGDPVMERTTPGRSGQYDIMHDSGKRVGVAGLEYNPNERKVYVDYVRGGGPSPRGESSKATKFNEWAHSLGTKELRSLLRSVAETFPKAETVTGDRISGTKYAARSNAFDQRINGQNVVVPSAVQSVRLPRQPGFGAPPGQSLTDLW